MLRRHELCGHVFGRPNVLGVGFAAIAAVGFLQVSSGQHGEDVRLPCPETIYIDGSRGSDRNSGNKQQPLKSISAAIGLLPDPLTRSVTIEWAAGSCATTGAQGMSPGGLVLMRRMPPGVTVRIVGRSDKGGKVPVMAWECGDGVRAMVDVTEGEWWLENVQVGSESTRQRCGVMVTGPGHVTLKNVTFRTRSFSGAGIYACRGGKVSLRGAIKLNEHLHAKAGDETFSGIIADDHGLVRFVERERASLDIGNGSLSASYYGCIRLGCETARITSWGEQSNNLAINNGGRIDLHGTTTTLCAKRRRNVPIGLEHDGHILAEGAHIIIEGENEVAVVLQKASTLTCNDIDLRGSFKNTLFTSSGSMFAGCFIGEVTALYANTGSTINILGVRGKIVGPVSAKRGGVVSLPDRNVFSK